MRVLYARLISSSFTLSPLRYVTIKGEGQPVEFFTTYFLQFLKCRLTYNNFRTGHSNFSLAIKPIFVLETDLITAYLDTLLVPHQTGIGTKSAPSRTRNKEQLPTLFVFLIFIRTTLERSIKICVVRI